MIGREEYNEDETALKVLDKRKFNADGSVRDGVTIEPEKPKVETPKATETTETPIYEPDAETVETYDAAATEKQIQTEAADELGEAAYDEDFPGADDPASFVNFLSTLASQAAAALGAIPHPATGQRTLDLETGKYWIEVLVMLKDKTKNNLHKTEQKLFDGILGDLQMQYVQVQRIAEEKLKQQAAQKFSASDILGKK
jgi:hypothetical protein